ncbi:hypothetical protein DACRYDRAFT_23542 [Dacryopinax primogenitus]|uniref:Uncharacterized protein n=1 Tax=Dacryopinax primogenitus (strain DJM 731) TaxID=1858805 RepID=M5G896_DACPD|nr:uncharacterized protein DACRYDRAFT_23510 [Dacryopinax primogenitus]XP_040626884.1 uncharacterized protein DACRYDRAFT_23542 [Dacryopinax primogenitus]EJT99977.1 hypothetical protein DACRYDRAFT_23510 [Dacryopinax primogenitus]EJT99986.1 hypothetical protein DACRYDRAFT_23542 [Dacryopinax primogenitus]
MRVARMQEEKFRPPQRVPKRWQVKAQGFEERLRVSYVVLHAGLMSASVSVDRERTTCMLVFVCLWAECWSVLAQEAAGRIKRPKVCTNACGSTCYCAWSPAHTDK